MKILILGATGLVGRNALAQALAQPTVTQVIAHQTGTQNFALVSAIGASLDSSFFYARVKGELERDVREIGFRSLTILRPSIIEGERDEVRLAENLVLKLSHFLAPVLPKRFHVNPAPKIAQVLVDSVVTAEPGCYFRYSDSLV